MKIWIKFLIGTIIGIFIALFPEHSAASRDLLSFFSELTINIGRYILFPLIFFSLAIGVYELKQEKRALKTYTKLILYLVLSTAFMTILGTLSVLIFSPERIPILIEEEVRYSVPGIREVLMQIFPKNAFRVFIPDGNFLLPLSFLSFFLGLNFSFDRLVTKPVIEFFDSMSRILYHINSFIVEIIGIGFIALTASFLLQIKSAPEMNLFTQLLIVISIDTVIVIFGIYPGLIYISGLKENPYKWLYAIMGPALGGFISKDIYFTLPLLIKHGKENLGIPRKIGSSSFPVFAIFGRAGTALVTSVSFIVIMKSYSGLGITFFQVLWVIVFSFLVSFVLGSFPGLGVFVALSLLCSLYGKGLDVGFLILKPVAPILVSFGVLLDIITAAFVSFMLSVKERVNTEVEVQEFI